MAKSLQNGGKCFILNHSIASIDIAPMAGNARSRCQFAQICVRDLGHRRRIIRFGGWLGNLMKRQMRA